jgi:beta-mannosidase
MAYLQRRGIALSGGWQLAETDGRVERPADLKASWRPATVPGTVAQALGLTTDGASDLDAKDYWYRKRIDAGETGDVLRFGGLATLADVWIDEEQVLRSENMFLEHAVDVRGRLRARSEIVIRFSSLKRALLERRPRPRWRATIVEQQQLRWFRTSLLGRIPAWTPPIAPVGPYRAITVEPASPITAADVRARLDGSDGIVEASFAVRDGVRDLVLVVGERSERATVDANGVARCRVAIPSARRWWPHTHGAPARVPVSVVVGDETLELGAAGFRTLEVDRRDGAFTLIVNGVRVFCRGACWMPLDVASLTSSKETLRAALERVRDAGMNMLRLSGTMLYESPDFHALCDELGILVWQDFMFANMDYPVADETFRASVLAEATQVMDRLQLSPSLAVCCGGSEVEQQSAMMGRPEGDWSSPLFRDLLPSAVGSARPDVVYVPSSPTGGALPFHVDEGVAHYYGVGAYMRPLEDARRSRVRFTSECLAFANIPRDETIETLVHDRPRWKQRVARDRGTSWDFDDVRDHYVTRIFGVDAPELRTSNFARYLELGRVATGEVMASAMSEWRRTRSECAGALVWFLRDLWEGAGWGIIDSRGFPKAPYYYLRRVLAPVTLLVTDEGLNGLTLHAVNDADRPLVASASVTLYREETIIAQGARDIEVPAHSAIELKADALLGRFTDIAHAYRFGPPGHDVTVAALLDSSGRVVSRAFHFPRGLRDEHADIGLEARASPMSDRDGSWRLTLSSRRAAHAVAVDARGMIPDDDFFHIAPGDTHEVVLSPIAPGGAGKLSATVKPLNAATPTRVV